MGLFYFGVEGIMHNCGPDDKKKSMPMGKKKKASKDKNMSGGARPFGGGRY